MAEGREDTKKEGNKIKRIKRFTCRRKIIIKFEKRRKF